MFVLCNYTIWSLSNLQLGRPNKIVKEIGGAMKSCYLCVNVFY